MPTSTIPHNPEVIMVPIHTLWLPILLSSVIVFLASSLIHMVFRYHSTDFRKLPDEDGVADALRKFNIPSGEYVIPHSSSMKEMNSPEFKEKMKKGPVAMLNLWAGGSPSMGANLTKWFIYLIVVGIFAAYVAGRALPPGAPYLSVFRFAGVSAFMCHVVALWQGLIWFRRSWSVTLKNTLDGLIYALLTAGVFGWLWPQM